MINDRIDGNGCFTCLAVTDNKLALSAADRHHGIDRLDTGLHRLMYGFTSHDAWSRRLDRAECGGRNRSFTVQRLSQRVNYTAKQSFADRYFHNTASTFDLVAFDNIRVRSKNNDTDVIFFEVKRHAHYTIGEFQQFAGHSVL